MAQLFNSQSKKLEEINFSRIINVFKSRWYFIVLSLVIALVASKLYLRYTKPVFFSSATIKVEEKNTATSALGYFSDLENFNDDINSEIQILNSRNLIMSALERMDLGVSYFKIGRVKSSEMYRSSPFEVVYDTSSQLPYGNTFILKYLGDNQFELSKGEQGNTPGSRHYFGESIDMNGFKFRVKKRESQVYPLEKNGEYSFSLNRIRGHVGRARGGLKIEQAGYMVSILRISSRDFVPHFTSDFVNSLCQVYLDYNEDNQRKAATQALEFIETQLDSLRDSLEASEKAIELFLVGKGMVSLEQTMGDEVSDFKSLEMAMAELEVKALGIDRIEKEVKGNLSVRSIPYSLEGTDAPGLASLIGAYNELIGERLAALQKLTVNHPTIKELDIKIAEAKNAIFENITSLGNQNDAKMQYFRKKIIAAQNSLAVLPNTRRGYVGLLREFEVRNKIYNNLLEKRAEAQIARESIIPSVRILDEALPPAAPVSPQPKKIYIMGTTLGISFGIILVLLASFMKNTISYRDEVESITLTPIIGVVRRSNISLKHKYPRLQSIENPKSSLSESIRAIRTNLQFISAEKESKIISITSTVSGEGKSFITINLGGIISILNKKVVILDLDLRKPKLHYSFGLDNSEGVSTYLVGQSEVNSIVKHTEYDNLDVITSGPIPPNPAELVQSVKMEELLEMLREKYDYILVDTPPIGLVTDGTTLLKYSDIALYVIRSDYSKKPYARIPDQLADEQKIKNLYIVFNSVSEQGGRYTGYGYRVYSSGYYSEEEQKFPWWQFWKAFKQRRR